MQPRVLIVSNLDSESPFGQFTRPFFLGRGLSRLGVEVGNVAPDCARVDFGPTWSTRSQSLRALRVATKAAVDAFKPDVLYAHQNMPAVVALTAGVGLPVISDVHSLPSKEWAQHASDAGRIHSLPFRVKQVKAFAAERLICRRSDAVIAAASELAEMLTEVHGARNPFSVNNGVDDRMLDAPATEPPDAFAQQGPHFVTLLPIGASPANALAFELLAAVVPVLRAKSPTCTVHLLGAEAGDGPSMPGLTYHGLVPDTLPWIENATACLLPYPREAVIIGAVRNKLLEFLARARILVTTEEGLRGFREAGDWDGVIVASDDVDGFATACLASADANASTLVSRREEVRQRVSWNAHAHGVLAAVEAVRRDRS